MNRLMITDSTGYWDVPENLDTDDFDFSWRPDRRDPPYIHVFGTQWHRSGGPKWIMFGAQGYKFHDFQRAYKLDRQFEWWVNPDYRVKFDFTWHPDEFEEPFIYVWGNQWLGPERCPTVEYRMPGATRRKYQIERAKILGNPDYWIEHDIVDWSKFDREWHPHPWDQMPFNYTWGSKWNRPTHTPVLEYRVPGAKFPKYMDEPVDLLIDHARWNQIMPVDPKKFDFSWRPPHHDGAYIYTWGSRWNRVVDQPVLEYRCDGAKERKYMPDPVELLPEHDRWHELIPVDHARFDFTWRPPVHDPPMIYVWGSRWNPVVDEPVLEYRVPEATERKYMTERVPLLPNTSAWKHLMPVDHSKFDFTWRPPVHDPPFIYVWGSRWNPVVDEPVLEYHVPGAALRKYMPDRVTLLPDSQAWRELIPVDHARFDFTWRPPVHDPPFIYVWGNQWNEAEVEPTLEYHVPGATRRKYMSNHAYVLKDMTSWSNYSDDDLLSFDFSWRPNPYSPPQIYQWEGGGPIYTQESAQGIVLMKRTQTAISTLPRYYIETTLEDLIALHKDETFWALRTDLDYTEFNFSWSPDETNFRHLNVFVNPNEHDLEIYYVNAPLWILGEQQRHYITVPELLFQESKRDMFYIDRGNSTSEENYKKLLERFPNLQKTRFLGSWQATIARCSRRAQSKLCWILSSELNYDRFDFKYNPEYWLIDYVHVFSNQWTDWGNTYLINAKTYADISKNINDIETINKINQVRTDSILADVVLHDLLIIDFGNEWDRTVLETRFRSKTIHTTEYQGSYQQTIKQWIDSRPETDFRSDTMIWVCSSVCDYQRFDFSYVSDPFQRLHFQVFSSKYGEAVQREGDTFLLNVLEFKARHSEPDYPVNYIDTLPAYRLQHPLFRHRFDTHYDARDQYEHDFPYAEYRTSVKQGVSICPSLWNLDRQPIILGSSGASQAIIPKHAEQHVQEDFYDYPFIITNDEQGISEPLDIVFLSNGERLAEQHYRRLAQSIQGKPNRLIRVDGISGRVQSYHAAARAARTPWFFAVFAKLEINSKFDWDWQPDRLQRSKHYIFHALNPVNNLEYGHQAMIAYNTRLVLANQGSGLDFTLDDLHEVVPILSGRARYNTDAYSTWRTAFREAIKLRASSDQQSQERLEIWLTKHSGRWGSWSCQGARDACDYYEQVQGNLDRLRLSYEWAWLQDYWTSLGHSASENH